jgi:hypothetical protein
MVFRRGRNQKPEDPRCTSAFGLPYGTWVTLSGYGEAIDAQDHAERGVGARDDRVRHDEQVAIRSLGRQRSKSLPAEFAAHEVVARW